MSYKCERCGKFIKADPATFTKEWDAKLIWCGGPTPEPSHEVFWHIECPKNKRKKNEIPSNTK